MGRKGTLRKFNSSPLKIDDWKISFLLGLPIFRGYVKFLGCNTLTKFHSEFTPQNAGTGRRSFLKLGWKVTFQGRAVKLQEDIYRKLQEIFNRTQ